LREGGKSETQHQTLNFKTRLFFVLGPLGYYCQTKGSMAKQTDHAASPLWQIALLAFAKWRAVNRHSTQTSDEGSFFLFFSFFSLIFCFFFFN
jgi:hypothetical protein